jgi:hypothetical protein
LAVQFFFFNPGFAMSSSLRDPKELTEWLELDYHRRPRGLRRWTGYLSWAALGLAGLFAVYALWPRNHTVFEAGLVSTAHAMFNDNCAACHAENFRTMARLWPPAANVRSVSNQTCKSCHDEPAHNPLVLGTEPDCASCHHEHRGQAALARVRDDHCTACHRDLGGLYSGKTDLGSVMGFNPGGHPPFRWWDGHNDPGTVAFNHKVHLAEAGVKKPGHPDPVRLRCDDCHRPDDAGRYMQPVRYEQHCKDCHPLSVQVTGEWKGDGIRKAAAAFARTPAPHREPEAVRAALRDRFAELARSYQRELFGLPPAAEPEEPRLPWQPVPPPLSKEEWDWTQQQLHASERMLFTRGGGCAYCHTVKKEWKAGGLPEYAPSQMNQRTFPKIGTSDRWLPQSYFNHHPHRIMKCTECHKAETSSRTKDVLLPAINNCMSCHNPQAGARSDCAECHQYHPRQGAHAWKMGGALPWGGEWTINDILHLGRP